MDWATQILARLVGTLVLRPYVFAFLACFLAASVRDLGRRRTLAFGGAVWSLAWLAEFSSTRIGIPFGLYHYTGDTWRRELYIANVPFMDSLSFTFLAYAAFCLARAALAPWQEPPRGGRRRPVGVGHWLGSRLAVAGIGGALMMALDVVIDPLAVRGDRWFLGRIFYYPEGGLYFGVPLSNFAGWMIVGAAGIGTYLCFAGDARGRERLGGVALYYAVALFNLAVTAWIGEWLLAAVGLGLHGALAVSLRYLNLSAEAPVDFGERGVQRA